MSEETYKAKLADCRKYNDQLHKDKMQLIAAMHDLRVQNVALQVTIRQLGNALAEAR